jgi:Autographiviridae endonuclease VII
MTAVESEERKQYRKRWRERNRDKIRGYGLKQYYGITFNQFSALLDAQGGRCAICEELFTKTPNVDHDHKSGKVRGILCRRCNLAMAAFDSPLCDRYLHYKRIHEAS